MSSMTEIESPGLSMEATPSGRSMPDWLTKALLSGRRILVIHPSEESRSRTLEKLNKLGNGRSIDTTHHLTLKRLTGILHIDLRLPTVLENDGVLFEKTHIALRNAAKEFKFPHLLSNPSHSWTRSRTRRLLALYQETVTLKKPWSWSNDPGVKSCNDVLKSIEKDSQAIHPLRFERTVWKALQHAKDAPFTINDVEGIIMLDHPPGLNEVTIEIINELSKFTGVHQLVNPGSHRLGFHGEYIRDISPVRGEESLPSWIPEHKVWAPDMNQPWSTSIGKEKGRIVRRVSCDLHEHTALALGNILNQIQGDIVVVSGDEKETKLRLTSLLESSGISIRQPSVMVSDTAYVARILSFTDLPRGEEAWSLSKLTDVWNQIELPMSWMIFDIQHPTLIDWKPRLHPEVLTEIARGFHLLGGRGALRRWLANLANATPRAGVDQDERAQKLEECQWWLSCLANWMSPIISSKDREALSEPIIGCTTGAVLPTHAPPASVVDWLNSTIQMIDWNEITQRDQLENKSLPGLQSFCELISKLSSEKIKLDYNNFSDILHDLAKSSEITTARNEDVGIKILSPDEAYGVETEFLILCGIDADTWSMRPKQVPWLDDSSRIEIGLHKPDLPLRKARHQLRHFLNCANHVLIIDSSLEDGIELAGPLDEWFSDLSREGKMRELDEPPSYLAAELWNTKTLNRPWELRTIKKHNRLVYRVNSVESSGGVIHTHRSGSLPRDSIQRDGISVSESRRPASSPLNEGSLIAAAEFEVLEDQFSRRRSGEGLEENQVLEFDRSSELIRAADLKIIPTKSKPATGRESKVWPHLGIMGKKGIGIAIDPKPISPPSTGLHSLDRITGRSNIQLKLPKVWSQGRLQSWLECPRRAWFERHMYIGKGDGLREDLAANVRGDIIHQVEEAILEAHGIQSGEISPLHTGKLSGQEEAWEIALDVLEKSATWMKREDGISAHRCRDLIGVSPNVWKNSLESGEKIEIGGRIGRMIQSDFSLIHVAPIACEWELESSGGKFVELGIPDSQQKFLLRGRIDRVDILTIDSDYVDDKMSEVYPLDTELGEFKKPRRLIIIRDIKSIDGTKDNGDNERHLKGIFHELQLALYARAWEIAHPGDRVIGIGATQVGINTLPFLEVDPDYIHLCENMEIGIIGGFTHEHYRLPGDEFDNASNPFRAWMRERITTALRVIENARNGKIHPEPSDSCKYCPIIDSCPSAQRGGW